MTRRRKTTGTTTIGKVVGIVGRQNSGKTHLVVRLIVALRQRGLAVSTIKHTHHHELELDQPGKDSWRHREAGAGEVIVASEHRWWLAHTRGEHEPPPTLDALLGRLAPCDVVLVEGYKGLATLPRIEVYRRAATPACAPLALDDPGIVALACPPDTVLAAGLQAPRLDLEDTGAIADFILRRH